MQALYNNGEIAPDTCEGPGARLVACDPKDYDDMVDAVMDGNVNRMKEVFLKMRPNVGGQLDREGWARVTHAWYLNGLQHEIETGIAMTGDPKNIKKMSEDIQKREEKKWETECTKLLLGTPSALSQASKPFCEEFMKGREPIPPWVSWVVIGGSILVALTMVMTDD